MTAVRSGPAGDAVLWARAYLSRVAEPPAPALVGLVAAVGSIEAAERVRRGAVSEGVARETHARRGIDRVEADLAAAEAVGARLLVPEDPAWPHWLFAAFDRRPFLPAGQTGEQPAADRDVADPTAGTGAARTGAPGAADSRTAEDRVDPGCGVAGLVVGDGIRGLTGPLALWVRGPGVAADLGERSIAFVGARAATGYGAHVAGELATGAAQRGFTVVSGAAIGIDAAAHRGALAVEGPTVAVLACGIDRAYPGAHELLLDRIASTGLVVSEYPPGSVPARHRFLVRNRLIAGLSAATVVVEAGVRSGAQRTAADARALGRPLMAVPGHVTSGRSSGCHRLIQEGALLVTRIEEVVEAAGRIGVDLALDLAAAPARPTDDLGGLAARVHDALPTRTAREPAWLALEAALPLPVVRVALRELERRGMVQQTGGCWHRPP